MRYQTFPFVALIACVAFSTGCKQGTSIPNPMTAFAPGHVPPPATGSYQIPDRYYKGQAGNSVGQASANGTSTGIASTDTTIGSGVTQSSFVQRGNATVAPVPTTSPVSSSNDLSGFRGFTTTPTPAPTSQPTTTAPFASTQDSPPAPQPSTAPLSWQSPVQ